MRCSGSPEVSVSSISAPDQVSRAALGPSQHPSQEGSSVLHGTAIRSRPLHRSCLRQAVVLLPEDTPRPGRAKSCGNGDGSRDRPHQTPGLVLAAALPSRIVPCPAPFFFHSRLDLAARRLRGRKQSSPADDYGDQQQDQALPADYMPRNHGPAAISEGSRFQMARYMIRWHLLEEERRGQR